MKIIGMFVLAASVAFLFSVLQVKAEPYEEDQKTSRYLILPEQDQFNLGSKLFAAKKYVAACKAFQTFLYEYPGSGLASDAQFMVAESIFAKSVSDLTSGNPPAESAWRRKNKYSFPWHRSWWRKRPLHDQ